VSVGQFEFQSELFLDPLRDRRSAGKIGGGMETRKLGKPATHEMVFKETSFRWGPDVKV
jgi:hypothetical protein